MKAQGGGSLPTVLFTLNEPLTVTQKSKGDSYGYTFDFADIYGKDFTITFSFTQASNAGNVSCVWYVGGYRNNGGIGFAKWSTGAYRFVADPWNSVISHVIPSGGLTAKFVLVARFSDKSATAHSKANGETDIVNNSNFLSATTQVGTENITFGGYSWAGTIHDMTIYDGELTAQQIANYLGA